MSSKQRSKSHLHNEETLKMFEKLSSSSNKISVSKSHLKLAETAHGVRMLSKNLSKTTVKFDARNILIVTKARDNSLVYLTREVAGFLLSNYEGVTVYVDHHLEKSKKFDSDGLKKETPGAKEHLKFWNKEFLKEKSSTIDLIITLGGDGTVLYVSSLFQRSVPPVISFSLGSLGFLTSFQFEDFKECLAIVLSKGTRTNLRLRLSCRAHAADGSLICEQQVLNEVTIDRGPSPFVSMLELYGDNHLLTVVQADGLIIATPTGSTAYSLSAGGSLVHPNVSAISVTPICPHTLSFRPIILPDSMVLKIKVPKRSRSTAWASFDGRSRVELKKGDYVTISSSPFSFPTVISSPTEYFDSVSRTLNWNIREQQKSFIHLLSKRNKTNYEKLSSRPKFNFNDSSEDEESQNKTQDDDDIDDALDYESPPDIDDDIGISSYFIPSPGEGIDTPKYRSHINTPVLSPSSKVESLDLSSLKLSHKSKSEGSN